LFSASLDTQSQWENIVHKQLKKWHWNTNGAETWAIYKIECIVKVFQCPTFGPLLSVVLCWARLSEPGASCVSVQEADGWSPPVMEPEITSVYRLVKMTASHGL
jgi:hypothetical protein